MDSAGIMLKNQFLKKNGKPSSFVKCVSPNIASNQNEKNSIVFDKFYKKADNCSKKLFSGNEKNILKNEISVKNHKENRFKRKNLSATHLKSKSAPSSTSRSPVNKIENINSNFSKRQIEGSIVLNNIKERVYQNITTGKIKRSPKETNSESMILKTLSPNRFPCRTSLHLGITVNNKEVNPSWSNRFFTNISNHIK